MKNIKIGIIDLKLNNIYSIFQACKNIGYKTHVITNNKKSFMTYDIIILPGVGSYKKGMNYIKMKGIDDNILEFSLKKNKLIFGICLGMQLLLKNSEEFGDTKGLNLVDGEVKILDKKKCKIIPHIGWSKISKTTNNKIFNKKTGNDLYYFVHSYYCKLKDKNNIIAKTNYNNFEFCCAFNYKNIIGTQFHPEKSGNSGLKILKNLSTLIK